jgi:hypothetical protein
VRDAQGLALAALRRITGYLAKKRVQLSKLSVKLPIEVANLLNNKKRKELLSLCDNYETEIDVLGDIKLNDAQIEFFEERRGYAGLRAKAPTRDYWDNENTIAARKGKSGEGYKKVKADLPLASIGPVPVLLDIEAPEENLNQALIAPENTAEHFDDPLMEALFGAAPQESLDELLALVAPDSVMGQEQFDVDSINQSLSGIDELEDDKQGEKPEPNVSKNHKRRFSSGRRRNYRSRRPPQSASEKPQLNR